MKTAAFPEPRGESWFGRERSFWQFCTAIFCAFAALKGITAPGNWVLTQALLNYSHGFIKRGLQGEVLALLHLHTFAALCVVFFLQLALLLVLLGVFTHRSGVQQRFGSLAPVAVFASSYAVTYMTFSVGYTDVLLMAMTVGLLLLRNPWHRLAAALVVVPLCLLVHENTLLMNLPVLLFSFVADALLLEHAARRRTLLGAGVLAVVAVAVTLMIALRPNLSAAESHRMEAELSASAGFDLHPEVFRVLARPLSGSMREAWGGLLDPTWLLPGLASLANLLPPTLFFLYLSRRLLRAQSATVSAQTQRWLVLAALVAVITPLLMYLLGFDFSRWNNASATAAYLVFLILCRDTGSSSVTLSPAERNALVFLLALNMATGFGFFGDGLTHPFPFFPALSENLR